MKRLDKLKNYILNYIKDNFKEIIFLIIFTCFCFYDTGYSIYKPGGIINVDERIKGDNLYKSEGSFNMAYVGFMEGKAPIYLFAKLMPNWEIVKNEDIVVDDENMKTTMLRDKLDYNLAMNNALYVALNYSNTKYEIKDEKHYIYYLTKENESQLEVGDELVSYDNNKYTSLSDFKSYINSLNVGDKIKLEYIRDGKTGFSDVSIYEEEGNKLLGISIVSLLDIETDNNIEITSKASESGPSGGLMTTLSIYNALTKEDLTGGKRIVGTGTIDRDGNIGKIGGVNYKIASAADKNADIFICADDNYEEVMEEVNKHNYKIKIIYGKTFEEIINQLKEEND